MSQSAMVLDQRDLDQYKAREDHGTSHRSRASNVITNYERHIANDKKHQSKQDKRLFQSSWEHVPNLYRTPRKKI